MKQKLIFQLSVLLLALSPALGAEDRNVIRERAIVVSGDGEASAAPDRAVVRLGAMAQNQQADVAQAKINEIMQKALEGIEKIGVQKRATRTSGLTLSPVYAPERGTISPNGGSEGPRVVGFRANNTVEVTVEDMKLVGKVIDAGIAAGANELQGVSFGLKDDLQQRISALTAATKEAKSKAETIAKALDVSLGSVIEVNEGGVHVMPMNENFGGARMMMSAKAMPTPVEPGEVRVRASVTVRYQIGSGAGGK